MHEIDIKFRNKILRNFAPPNSSAQATLQNCISRYQFSVYGKRLLVDDMVLSAHNHHEKPLSRANLFWERLILEPPIRWENWRIQLKLTNLARENLAIDTLIGEKRKQFILPKKPKYEEPIAHPTEPSGPDRQTRNNLCQKLIEVGLLCGERL